MLGRVGSQTTAVKVSTFNNAFNSSKQGGRHRRHTRFSRGNNTLSKGGSGRVCGGVSGMGRAYTPGGLGRSPTPVLPCAQDSAHVQAATKPTGTYLRRPPQTRTDPPGHRSSQPTAVRTNASAAGQRPATRQACNRRKKRPRIAPGPLAFQSNMDQRSGRCAALASPWRSRNSLDGSSSLSPSMRRTTTKNTGIISRPRNVANTMPPITPVPMA